MLVMLPADLHHLQAAQGWFELGDYIEANKELENINPQFRSHHAVLEFRWQICAKAKDWIDCVDIGEALTELASDKAVSWIHHAYALHELKRKQEAFDVLSPVAVKFLADAITLECTWIVRLRWRGERQQWDAIGSGMFKRCAPNECAAPSQHPGQLRLQSRLETRAPGVRGNGEQDMHSAKLWRQLGNVDRLELGWLGMD